MIVDKKYKITWGHYNKDNDVELTNEKLRVIIFEAISSSTRIEAMEKISSALDSKERYDKSFSRCIIEIGGEFWTTFSTGMAIVHPNDTFNRKKGVLVSFSDAVSNIEDRVVRTILWNAFWKVREPKREHIQLKTERDRNLRVFLEETCKKRIQGKHIIYTIPEKTEIYFPRND